MVKRLSPILILTGICWLVFLVNNTLSGGHLSQYGIVPRHLSGLPGVLWAPFLHASFRHLAANSVPLLILGGILCLRGRNEFGIATTGGILLGGLLTWLIGRSAIHIGASGLVFCYFGYVASLAWFQRGIGTLLLSLLCIVGYGGLAWGIIPTSTAVSWESHLAGMLSGVFLAWATSKIAKEPKPANAPAVPSFKEPINR